MNMKMKIGEMLSQNPYPGRGIVVGKSPDAKKAVMAYFLMGRSENSRNRRLWEDKGSLHIQIYDPKKLEDPSLIMYSPIKRLSGGATSTNLPEYIIITNGDQTDTIYDFQSRGTEGDYCFEAALSTREFEPDAPNFTPRISALIKFNSSASNPGQTKSELPNIDSDIESTFTYKINILKAADKEGSACNRQTFSYSPLPGLGHFIHTYVTDGNPLPTFAGEPKVVEIPDDIDEFTDVLWGNLNKYNKIALYVEYIDVYTGVREIRLHNIHGRP